jgi:DNA-directed RNA polymerase II subunit RPB2
MQTCRALLPKHVVFDAISSERKANGIASHQLHSMDQMLEHHIPNIILERPEILAQTPTQTHIIEITHVHIGMPVARAEGGFYGWIEPHVSKATKHTYANPVVIDAIHRIYSNTCPNKEITWETIDAVAIDKEIQALEGVAAATPTPKAAADGSVKIPPRRTKPILDNDQKEWVLVEERTYRKVNQFCMPTMVRSIGCWNKDAAPTLPNDRADVEGYFIVKGTEKTIQTQRRLHINRFYVFKACNSKWSWTGEIRACHAAKIRSTSTLRVNIRCGTNGSGVLKGTVEMPYIEIGIPIMAVCMVLGFQSAKEVAVCAATGGVLSGLDAIPEGSWWDVHPVHTARLWILSLLNDDAHLYPPFETMSRSKILQWIGEEGTKRKTAGDRAKLAAHLMANEFLPQLGLNSSALTIAKKGQYFAMMLGTIADVVRGLTPPDDRDHAGNRQYETAGMLCANLARQHYRNFRKKLSSEIRRFAEKNRFVGVPELLHVKRMTDGFVYAMSTGNWGLQKGGSTQTGVVQMLNRMNQIATQSHLRRTDTPLKREGKQTKPRQTHISSFGQTCPAETPEGPACGLVEQLAQGVWICQGHSAERLIRRVAAVLTECIFPVIDASVLKGEMARLPPVISQRSSEARNVKPMVLDHEPEEWAAVRKLQRVSDALLSKETTDITRVLINGVMIGFVTDGQRAARQLRLARRARQLPFDVAIELNFARKMLCVTGEAGGLRRPLFVLDADNSLEGVERVHAQCASLPPEEFWKMLVQQGLVEYLSKHEEDNMLVMTSPCVPVKLHAPLEDHTHCEIHPSMMLGIAAATIPFSEHNQAPRTSYYASMCKQTAGTPAAEVPYTNGLRLWYPQTPLVTTWSSIIHGVYDAPMGLNAWIVVASDGGRNQEDSLYMNSDSKDRGMFACSIIKSFTEDCQGGTGADAQHFEKPPSYCHGRKTGNYNKLGASGLVSPGDHVRGGDAIIGKTMDVNDIGCVKRSTIRRDQSVLLPSRDKIALEVTEVMKCKGRDDRQIVAVRTQTARFLQTGDKLTSVHGQKGVVGCLKPARDMPYTADGIIADVIINPHAFPSRMTIGQMLESALGMVCANNGETADGTPFNGTNTEDIRALLAANGFDSMGEQVMYKGETGEQIKGELFFGCTYYQRVKQMVEDKHHARARGPVHILTQQPVEGRSKEGGFRMGDMERDCLDISGQILTNFGFLFLDEVLAIPREDLQIAAYNPVTKAIVYETPTEIVVNPAREQTLVEFTQKNEACKWTEESDAYGVALSKNGAKRSPSNRVSLLVTHNHDMYSKSSNAFVKMKASALLPSKEKPNAAVKFLAKADSGLVLDKPRSDPEYMHLIGGNAMLEPLFLELYGYWLGDGSMTFQSGSGRDALQFKIVKLHDIAWLEQVFGKLGLELGTHFTKSGPTGSAHEFQINLIDKEWVQFYFQEYRHRYPSGHLGLKRKRGPKGSSNAVMDPNFVSPETRIFVNVSTSKSSLMRPDGVKSAKWFASWTWNLPKDLARSVLSGLRRADGKEKSNQNAIFTSSSRFRDEIVRLCMHAGYSARFSLMYGPGSVRGISHRGKEIISTRHAWLVSYENKDVVSAPVLHAGTDIREVPYTGRTWCVTVPSGHIFARRAHSVDGVVTKASVAVITGNCVAGHGAANVALDRYLQQSDYSEIPICTKCCTVAMPRAPADQRALIVNCNEMSGYCLLCKEAGTVYSVPMPFATKLFAMELMTAHVRTEFVLDKNPNVNPYTTAAIGMKRARSDIEEATFQPAAQYRRKTKQQRAQVSTVTAVPAEFRTPSVQLPPRKDDPWTQQPVQPSWSCSESGSGSPPYTYTPASPPYTPASPPYTPASPPYTPASPPYTPASPPYTPASPTYSIGSSVYSNMDLG